MAKPLDGVRIVDLTTHTQGAGATGLLCDLGAEVIKVERPGSGDPGRRIGLLPSGASSFFEPQNRGKRSVVVDIQTPEGRDAVLRLAERSDVIASNFRKGVMERAGLGYEEVRAVNPSIIYASATGYGPEGPDASAPALDLLGQARGGLVAVTGREPTPVGAIVCDYVAAMHLAVGILSCLVQRHSTGNGEEVDGAMLGSIISMQGWEFAHHLLTGEEPVPNPTGHPLVRGVYGIYRTADGHVAMAGATVDQVLTLIALLTQDRDLDREWLKDGETSVSPELKEELSKAIARWTSSEVLEAARSVDIKCQPVQSYAELAVDPQAVANGYVRDVQHPDLGAVRLPGLPLRFGGSQLPLATSAPRLGEHTAEVLGWLGYGADEARRVAGEPETGAREA